MATSPKSRGRKSAGKNTKEVVEDVPEETPAEEQEDDEEEGYEVEAILDARWAFNRRGKWSYYVHWKGYGSDEDMWIDEDDAAGAEELIEEWHKNNDMPRDGKGKKKNAPTAKRGRPSTGAASKDKKRKASSTDGMDVDTPEAEEPPAKKTTKRSAKPPQRSPEPEVEAEDEDEEAGPDFQAIDDIMKKARWDGIVKSIETVEASGDGLTAFFTRADGKKSKCSTTILAERCPQLLIDFYESHLKWRPTEEDE
ncbi:chromo shadow domain protein [Ceratobasidium sp. AG-Ba]|nr:chromo shadow domain protein [Ceratobasidium sp. AG-Ba]QRW03178.1 chromo shadow domain protein [Ceratobasidium sp. AG-Ba]